MIPRNGHLAELERLLKSFPVIAIVGARQIGKTTLARMLSTRRKGPVRYFDLEDPRDLNQLSDPMLALAGIRGLIVLDEIHRRPELFPVLRVLADRRPLRSRFLVLGSASPELLRQGSESLAGRIAYYSLPGLGLEEVGYEKLDRLWLRGRFPRAFIAKTLLASNEWIANFIRTFLERDIPSFGLSLPSETLFRFWSMLAHYHGQLWNGSEFARSFGVSDPTVRRYLDLLTSMFVVRQLQPWFENIGKRQVKSPKVYIADTGLLHNLLDIDSQKKLERHPKVGASWEGFMLENVIQQLGVRQDQCFFWRTHTGAELDLFIHTGRKRWGFEFKRTTTPKLTRSMHSAWENLKLTRLDVVHAGKDTFPLSEKIRAVAASRLLKDL
jgi:predicted AAA+ superfamily ATPase